MNFLLLQSMALAARELAILRGVNRKSRYDSIRPWQA